MTPKRLHGVSVRTIGFVIGCVVACLLYCTTTLTSGNSSETTNVAIVTDNGLPATSAVAKLIDGDNWAYRAVNGDALVIDSVTVDQYGIAIFSRLPETSCNLQIDYNGSGIFVRNFSRMGKATLRSDTIRLQKYATLFGQCSSDSVSPVSVMLEGTAYSSTISTKAFSFDAIAPGLYPLLFSSASGGLALAGSAVLTPDQTIAKNTLCPSFNSLLIDDFESGYTTSVLGQFTDGSWYDYADTGMGGASTAEHALQIGAPQGVFCLAAEFVLQKPLKAPWAGIGVFIGAKRAEWNLSAMTAISFWARGSNTIRISIESPLVDSINESWPDFGKAITLDSTWRLYRIPVDSLTLLSSKAKDQGITWNMAAKRIYRIEIEGVTSTLPDTFKVQLDDIRLEGITASDLFRQMGPKEQR